MSQETATPRFGWNILEPGRTLVKQDAAYLGMLGPKVAGMDPVAGTFTYYGYALREADGSISFHDGGTVALDPDVDLVIQLDWSGSPSVIAAPTLLDGNFGMAIAHWDSVAETIHFEDIRDIALSRPSRVASEVSFTTDPLAHLAAQSGWVEAGRSIAILRATLSAPGRVRLYATEEYQIADEARGLGTGVSGEHGMLYEGNHVAGNLELDLMPQPRGSNLGAVRSGRIYWHVQNRSGALAPITVTLLRQITEG